MTDDFLARWSRRKLEGPAVAPEPAGAAELKQEPASAPPQEKVADDAITPEEIAALPAISEISAHTDVTAFLRKGVPLLLRNAALQKFWVLDPEIRNFVGEARDYAWDWNTPGGVPVSGVIEPNTDVEAMLRRVFGEEPAPDVRENVIAEETLAAQMPVQEHAAVSAVAPIAEVPSSEEKSCSASAEERAADDIPPPHRHGGALPA